MRPRVEVGRPFAQQNLCHFAWLAQPGQKLGICSNVFYLLHYQMLFCQLPVWVILLFCNSSINGGRRVFLTRLTGGRRLFVTYQWGKPQLDEVENAEGASVPRR
ncbi:MAG: hypothetical protein B1H11_11790 [Desulfobacteraceae bacterium 4484_190.1]|nr:MAG: hypothetical protein B1H11_11790 [Desulfobacteraceae bacterium 4484_190.1]